MRDGAQPIEHRRIVRPLIEKDGIEIPKQTIGGVVEGEPLIGPEDGNAGGQLVEGAPVRIHHALELAAQPFCFGRVDGDAGAAAPGRHRHHVEAAALTRDHGRQAARIGLDQFVRAQKLGARASIEQLDSAIDRLRPVLGLDRPRIRLVRENEFAGVIARPHRRSHRFDQGAGGGGVFELLLVTTGEFGEFAA